MNSCPPAAIASSKSWFCSAHFPVIPKLARTPSARSVSRMIAVYPASLPASNVSATIRRAESPRYTTVAFSPVGIGVEGSGIGWVGTTVGAATVGSAVGGDGVAEARGTVAEAAAIVSVSPGDDVTVGPVPADEQAATRPATAPIPATHVHHRVLFTFAITLTTRLLASLADHTLGRRAKLDADESLARMAKKLPKEEQNITRSHGHRGRILSLL